MKRYKVYADSPSAGPQVGTATSSVTAGPFVDRKMAEQAAVALLASPRGWCHVEIVEIDEKGEDD